MQVKKANYTFTVELPESNNGSAGICLYGTSENGFGLSVANRTIELWQIKQGNRTLLATKTVETYPLTLCLKTQFGQYCQFGLMEQNKFQAIGQPVHLNDLPQWDRPSMVGISARGTAESVFSNVSLTWE